MMMVPGRAVRQHWHVRGGVRQHWHVRGGVVHMQWHPSISRSVARVHRRHHTGATDVEYDHKYPQIICYILLYIYKYSDLTHICNGEEETGSSGCARAHARTHAHTHTHTHTQPGQCWKQCR